VIIAFLSYFQVIEWGFAIVGTTLLIAALVMHKLKDNSSHQALFMKNHYLKKASQSITQIKSDS